MRKKNLKELVEEGILKEGEEIYLPYRGVETPGRITKDGKIETFLGIFSIGQSTVKIMSLNPRCERAIESANGYDWWKTWNGTSLKDLRKN